MDMADLYTSPKRSIGSVTNTSWRVTLTVTNTEKVRNAIGTVGQEADMAGEAAATVVVEEIPT